MNSVQMDNSRINNHLKIYLISMIRNESDIIIPFIRQGINLFDEIMFIDVQSTDSTELKMNLAAIDHSNIRIFKSNRKEKYQSIMMNLLSRKAFEEGANWVFFLDADEFLNINSRELFESYLKSFSGGLMYLPWINLVPSQYGDFNHFDFSQTYYWSGRPSKFHKIAISDIFAEKNKDYYIHEGNHNVSKEYGSIESKANYGLSIFHLPIRSKDRFKYKIYTSIKALNEKHNSLEAEGSHTKEIYQYFEEYGINELQMNYLAAWYGDSISRVSEIEPSKLNWPTKTMPIHLASCAQEHNPTSLNIVNVMIADSKVNWENEPFVSNSKIRAVLSDDSIQIQPQPVYGSGKLQRNKYISLESKNSQIPDEFNIKNLEDALIASFTKISTLRFSAWSSLIPTLYILFSFLKPRRYVELGTHYGTSFFAACQANQEFDTNTQCIAIDSWIGDEHASFYSDDVFCNFKQHMKENYPDQQYIRGYFSQALNCFEDGSIDLLHIDGFHTYDAVKSDFDAWLPKLSKCGVIILHDTEVYERNFGVWRLLSELKKNYSCFNVPHGHGLGIVYVGREPSPISYWLSYFANQVDVSSLVNIYLEAIGTLSVETKNMIDKMAELKNLLAQACEERDDSISKLTLLTDDRNIIVSSISWRITSPIREFRNRYPRVSGQIRRIIKLVWWTITGKLYSRLKEKVSSVESVGK